MSSKTHLMALSILGVICSTVARADGSPPSFSHLDAADGQGGYIIGCSFIATFKISGCQDLPSGKAVQHQKEILRLLKAFDDQVVAAKAGGKGVLSRIVTKYDLDTNTREILSVESVATGASFDATLSGWLIANAPSVTNDATKTLSEFFGSEKIQFVFSTVNSEGQIERAQGTDAFLNAVAANAHEAKRIAEVRAAMVKEQLVVEADRRAAQNESLKREREARDAEAQRRITLGAAPTPARSPAGPAIDANQVPANRFYLPVTVPPAPLRPLPSDPPPSINKPSNQSIPIGPLR